MNSEEAKAQLADYRRQQGELRKKIEALRAFLRQQGIDPDPPPVDLTERNKAIYGRYLNGVPYADIAKGHKLSTGRVRDLCQRTERRNAWKAAQDREATDPPG